MKYSNDIIKWSFQKLFNILVLIVWVGIIWWDIETSDISNKIGMLWLRCNCIIIENWSYKSVFNWCYPPNLFAYDLISKRNVGDPVWVLRGQLPQYLTLATNLLEEITNTRKLFCSTHPPTEWRWQNQELIELLSWKRYYCCCEAKLLLRIFNASLDV